MIIENIDDIEIFLEVKFGDMKGEDFFHKSKRLWGDEDYIIGWEEMIEELAEIVEQHLVDEEFTWDATMPNISAKQWDTWLEDFYPPERDVCSCSNGCKTCLMTEW